MAMAIMKCKTSSNFPAGASSSSNSSSGDGNVLPAQEFVLKLFLKTPANTVGNASSDDFTNADPHGKALLEYRRLRFSLIGGSICWTSGSRGDSDDDSNNNETPQAALPPGAFDALLNRAREYFAPLPSDPNQDLPPSAAKIRLVSQDEDQDWVVIASNDDLQDAISAALTTPSAVNPEKAKPFSLSIGVELLSVDLMGRNFQTEETRSTHVDVFIDRIRNSGWNWMDVLVVGSVLLGILVGMFQVPRTGIPSVSTNEKNNASFDKTLEGILSDVLEEKTGRSSWPLWRALEWVKWDPHWKDYPHERLRQRFGLAALYFATNSNTNQETWKRSDGWLSYETHECHWWPGSFTMSICGEDQYHDGRGDGNKRDWQYDRLWLPNNGLDGSIPGEVFTLIPTLKHVRLDRNIWLEGTLAPEIGSLTNLKQLWLQHNMLSGTLPQEMSLLTSLEKLCLAENKFEETLSGGMFGKLTSLRKLWLHDNMFSGPVPDEVESILFAKTEEGDDEKSARGQDEEVFDGRPGTRRADYRPKMGPSKQQSHNKQGQMNHKTKKMNSGTRDTVNGRTTKNNGRKQKKNEKDKPWECQLAEFFGLYDCDSPVFAKQKKRNMKNKKDKPWECGVTEFFGMDACDDIKAARKYWRRMRAHISPVFGEWGD